MFRRMEEEKTGKRIKRKATPSRRWPNAIVPYEIAPNTFSKFKIVPTMVKRDAKNKCIVFQYCINTLDYSYTVLVFQFDIKVSLFIMC